MLPVMRAKGIWRGRVSDPYTYAQMWAATRKLQLFCAVSLGGSSQFPVPMVSGGEAGWSGWVQAILCGQGLLPSTACLK